MIWLSCPDKTERQVPLFTMDKITQDMRFKQVVIEYSLKYGVTKAAIRYKTTRQNIYRWRRSMTVRFVPLQIAPTFPTAILINTQKQRLHSSRTCDAGIRMPVWWFSGLSCGNAVIPDPSPACTAFCAGLTANQLNYPTPKGIQALRADAVSRSKGSD